MKNIGERSEFRRHTCHFCRGKKYELKMRKLGVMENRVRGQYGNDTKLWICIACERKGVLLK